MRTTLTIDDDLAVRLEQLRAERGLPFKQAVNEVLRAGLSALDSGVESDRGEPQVTLPLDLGRQLIDVTNVAEALALAEGDPHR